MKTKIKLFIIIGVIAGITNGALLLSAHAQSSQITSGLSWLSANQSQDGSWTEIETTDYHSTAEVLTTLFALGNKGTSYTNGLNWLNLQTVNDTHYLSERISINGGAYSAEDLSALLSYRQTDGGFGGFSEYLSNNRHTALALLALQSANYPDQTVITNAISYLLSNQNSDGGFGFYSGDASNIYMTSLVLNTLSQFKTTYNLQTPINNAVSYLLSKQNTDGGFGSSSSTIYETALSVISLIASGQGQALPLQNAINYLTTTQQPNGSWNDDPYSTALALRALANVKPNLSISPSDITFSNPAPTVGDTIIITAHIRNTGPLHADNIAVQFYNGDPNAGGVLIGETTVLSIPEKRKGDRFI